MSTMAPMTYHVDYFNIKSDAAKTLHICTEKWTIIGYFYYVIFTGTVVQFIPLMTILVAYGLILYELRRNNPHLQITNVSTHSRRRRLNLFKIQKKFMYIVGAFFVLTLPFSVFIILTSAWQVYDMAYHNEHLDTIRLMHEVFFMMSIFNSCVNPIIYGNWNVLLCLCRGRLRKSKISKTAPMGQDIIAMERLHGVV